MLHQLGGWPAGLWMRTDEGAAPFGEVLQVKPGGGAAGGLLALTLNPKGVAAEELFTVTAAAQQSLVSPRGSRCSISNPESW